MKNKLIRLLAVIGMTVVLTLVLIVWLMIDSSNAEGTKAYSRAVQYEEVE